MMTMKIIPTTATAHSRCSNSIQQMQRQQHKADVAVNSTEQTQRATAHSRCSGQQHSADAAETAHSRCNGQQHTEYEAGNSTQQMQWQLQTADVAEATAHRRYSGNSTLQMYCTVCRLQKATILLEILYFTTKTYENKTKFIKYFRVQ